MFFCWIFLFRSYVTQICSERLSVSQKARIKHEIKASWAVMYIASILDIVYFVNGCLCFMHKYFYEKNRKWCCSSQRRIHLFKPTQHNSSGRLRVGTFGLEIWNIGEDMIISMEIAVSSISNKVLQLHLVQETYLYAIGTKTRYEAIWKDCKNG